MESMSMKPEPEYRKVLMFGLKATAAILILFQLPFILFVPETGVKIGFGVALGITLVLMWLWALWIPAYWRTLEYSADADAVRMNGGVFWRKRVTVPYTKITNVDITQGPVERMNGVGTVHVQTAGAGGAEGARAEIRLSGVRDTELIRDRILEGMRGAGGAGVIGSSVARHEQPAETEMLGKMLEELTAMRKLLERGR